MAEEKKHPHLLITGTAETERFVSPSTGGGSESRIPARNRVQHGRVLLQQLRTVSTEATTLVDEQRAAGVNVGVGVTIEFESEAGFDLPTESLGYAPSKIELLSVRKVGEKTFATVFVPDGKLIHFEKLVDSYINKNTAKKKPKNEKVVANLADIRLATLRALWTDDQQVFPATDAVVWWEIWLRTEGEREAHIGLFRDQGKKIGLEISKREIRFMERTVVAAKGTSAQLSKSIRLLNSIAEIRLLKETAEFFSSLSVTEQRKWADELINRTTWAGKDAPAICILDTGVNHQHPLIASALDAKDLQTNNPAWSPADENGHGTEMAGLALFGDLTDCLQSNAAIQVAHRLESVKILRHDGDNEGELYGDITREAIARAETQAPKRQRVVCMAVSATDSRDRGKPSAWSATLDALSSGAEDDTRRLLVVSAGNIPRANWPDYPNSNFTDGIHDPGQAWNVLTVGAYTDKDTIDPKQYPGFKAVAEKGDLGPASCTAETWPKKKWPLKPDVVLEGGNAAHDPQGGVDTLPSLDLLTTHHQPNNKLFTLVGDTSAATALAARMGATIQAAYPQLWPETVRALIVHSAEWTPTMLAQHLKGSIKTASKNDIATLIRRCGFGVPSTERALWSARNSLTLIAQDELQPFDEIEENGKRDVKSRDMNLHAIPWPVDVLESLGETEIEMQVTLSYFVEPNPAERGWTRRYRYESHGLRFDVKRPKESLPDFRRRINQVARDGDDSLLATSDDLGWIVGKQNRHVGSIHSDRWIGMAAELSARGHIAVYPALGWWRERKGLERWGKKARYALLVSIRAPAIEADIYTAVAAKIKPLVANMIAT